MQETDEHKTYETTLRFHSVIQIFVTCRMIPVFGCVTKLLKLHPEKKERGNDGKKRSDGGRNSVFIKVNTYTRLQSNDVRQSQ
jgi:hypothetical protein